MKPHGVIRPQWVNDSTNLLDMEPVLFSFLTHWVREMHIYICVGNLTIIGSDNGLSPGRRQAIIWTNAGILLIGFFGTNFSEILIKIYTFSLKKNAFENVARKWRPFCLGLNVLTPEISINTYSSFPSRTIIFFWYISASFSRRVVHSGFFWRVDKTIGAAVRHSARGMATFTLYRLEPRNQCTIQFWQGIATSFASGNKTMGSVLGHLC